MKLEELTEEISKMENFYDKKMPEEEKKEWIKYFIKIDLKRFKYLVSMVYKEEKFMPKLAEMIEKNKNLGFIQNKPEGKYPECKKCNNTGYIPYWKDVRDGDITRKYQFVAVCDYCNREKQYITEKNYMPKASEIGL